MKWYFNPFKRDKSATEDARQELKAAEKELKLVKEQGTEVTAVSKKLRVIRQENHFAERLHITMGGTQL